MYQPFIKQIGAFVVAIIISVSAQAAAPADSGQLGALLMAIVISGTDQAPTPVDARSKSSAATPALRTAQSASGSRAAEFIAALKAKLDARNAAVSALHRVKARKIVSASELK